MTDQEQEYRALVADEARGTAPEGTSDRLAVDPDRWRNALQDIRLDIASQASFRKAEMVEFHTQCRRMSDGKERYFTRQAEYLRWEASMKRFRAGIERRLAEVSRMAKDQKHAANQSGALAEWKTLTRDLLAIVGDMLAIPADEVIPDDLWTQLESAYEALPHWMHHTETYRAQELTAAAD